MVKSFFGLLLFFMIFLGVIASLQAQENYELRNIVFHGNKALEEDFLLERMALKEVSFLEKMITSEQPFLYNQRLVDLDIERLKLIYRSEGFLNAEISLEPLQINNNRKTVKLRIAIDEGDPVRVDSVAIRRDDTLSGINIDSLQHKVSRSLKLKKGVRFRDAALNEDVLLIENAFRNLGYAYVEVKYDLDINLDELETSIFYVVKPGPICQFGETVIEGNKHVSAAFIRKQQIYAKGELYNKSRLTETRENLYRLQLFRVVSVLPQRDQKTYKDPIPVQLYLEEAPRLDTRFGFGYGTEDKFRTFLNLNYRGFWGGARRINLYLKHSDLMPYHASLKWIQPQFLSKRSSISLNPFVTRSSEPGYETRTYGINIPVTYQFNRWFNSTLTYYLENVEQHVEQGDVELPNAEELRFAYNKSGVLLSTVFNNSNPQFSPSEGYNLSVGFKMNGHLFGNDFSYTRIWGDFRHYQKIGDWVLATRIMAGGIRSADSDGFIPVEDRFYSGGSNSIRGWNRSELGPKRDSGTPLGGKSILETNMELRYPLFWRVSGVAFIEGGNVWRNSYRYRISDLAYAAGGGLRIDTPIGPIRLDVGVPVWNEKKSPQFFISVGQAF